MSIKENIISIKKSLPENVKLVAVSKTKPEEDLQEAYDAGQRIFGENKVQDLTRKYENLPKDIQWHYIGHLQTNKVKYIAPFVSLIHAIDSLKLLKMINKEAKKNDRKINCLLQMHIADEDSKFGMDKEELYALINSEEYKEMENVTICGLMGMATFTNDEQQIEQEFKQLKSYFDEVKKDFFADDNHFCEISMGMSGDYPLAIECGSTMVRVGSSIFGARNY